jgi:GTP cyclohydrolase I
MTMNSFSTLPEPGPSHGDLLADRLTRLDVDVRDQPVQAHTHHHTTSLPPPKTPHDGYGYGFRPLSGMSSPRIPPDRNSPLPDVNGLGWPGQFTFSSHPLRPPASRSPRLPSPNPTSKVHPLSP